MLEQDRLIFESAIRDFGFTIRPDRVFAWICTPNGNIQYQLSEITEDYLTAGRIAVKTDELQLASDYRRLRKWITTRYQNDVYGKNDSAPAGPTNPARYPSMYVGPSVANALSAGKLTLRQFKGGRAVFSIGIPTKRN